MGKKNTQLLGFAYNNTRSRLQEPEAAIVVDDSKGVEITSRTTSIVPLSEFKLMVAAGQVKDMKLKEDELVLTAMRKGLRSGGSKATTDALSALGSTATELTLFGGALYSTGQSLVAEGARQAASAACTEGFEGLAGFHEATTAAFESAAAASGEVYASAGGAAEGILNSAVHAKDAAEFAEMAAVSRAGADAAFAASESAHAAFTAAQNLEGAANAGANAAANAAFDAAESAEVAAGSLHWLIPAVIIGTVTASLYVTTKAVTGVATRGKVYEYVPVRMVSEHMKRAEESSTHIAACVAGFQRERNMMLITLFLYGDGVKDFLLKIMKDFPQLGGNIAIPTGSFTSISVPYALLAKPEFYTGYHLMFNTINFYDEAVCTNIVKQTRFSRDQVLKIAEYFDTLTADSLASESTALTDRPAIVEKTEGVSNVAAYCKKYGITEEQFKETEVPRLCAILGCDENSIEEKVGELVYD